MLPPILLKGHFTLATIIKKFSYVRKHRDISKTLGPGSEAEMHKVLAFGTLLCTLERFGAVYRYPWSTRRPKGAISLMKIESLPFTPEIIAVGKKFGPNNIKKPFICVQLTLLDGQFKNHWKTTFSAVKQKLKSTELQPNENMGNDPIHVFLMTDLPTVSWTGTYLEDLAKDASYQLHTLDESSELIVEARKRLMASEHGIKSSFLPRNYDCGSVFTLDILLYVLVTVCSFASVGFVGTAGSTIADNTELIRKYNACKL